MRLLAERLVFFLEMIWFSERGNQDLSISSSIACKPANFFPVFTSVVRGSHRVPSSAKKSQFMPIRPNQ